MITKYFAIYSIPFFLCTAVLADGTNFVITLNAKWETSDASNVLSYVETDISTNASPEAYFARGLVAAYLETWGRGATNYLAQAADAVDSDPDYTSEQKTSVKQSINQVKGHFSALVEEAEEPEDSEPQWNTNTHAVIFSELDEMPFLHVLQKIVVP